MSLNHVVTGGLADSAPLNLTCNDMNCTNMIAGSISAGEHDLVTLQAQNIVAVDSKENPLYILPKTQPTSAEDAMVSLDGIGMDPKQIVFKKVPLLDGGGKILEQYMPNSSIPQYYTFSTIALRNAYVGPPPYEVGDYAIVTADPTPADNGNYIVSNTGPLTFIKLYDGNGVRTLNGLVDSIEIKSADNKLTVTAGTPTAQDIELAVDESKINIENLLNAPTSAVVGINDVQKLTNKKIDESCVFTDTADDTKQIIFNVGGTTGKTLTLSSIPTDNRILFFPDTTDTLVGTGNPQNLSNKTLRSNPANALITDNADTTKEVVWDLSGQTTGTKTTFTTASTIDRSIAFPDAFNDTVVLENATQTLTSKDFKTSCRFANTADPTKKLSFNLTSTAPSTQNNIILNATVARSWSLPDATGEVVIDTHTQTLTNKTIDDVTNTVRAGKLATTGAPVVISGAAPPTTGYSLQATSATTATWQAIQSALDEQQAPTSVLVSTTSTGYIDLPTMTLTTSNTYARKYLVCFSGYANNNKKDRELSFILNINGVDQTDSERVFSTHDNGLRNGIVSIIWQTASLASGIVIKVRYKTSGDTISVFSRNLLIRG